MNTGRNYLRFCVWLLTLASTLGNIIQGFGNDLIVVWNDLALRAIRYANVPPPIAVRQMATVHLAIFDAANGIDCRYNSYSMQGKPPELCSAEAAVTESAYQSLRTLFPKSAEELDSHHRAILAAIPNTIAKTNGIAWGKLVASQFLRLRQFDGAGQSSSYVSNSVPGYWQRTLPNYDKPLLPNWGRMKPFAIENVESFRPAAPPAVNSSQWAQEYNQVKALGATNSVSRTGEQREIALFWADGPKTETPPGHWNRIAQQLARKKSYSIVESAALFAALNVAMADTCIVAWESKYHYNWWRPITAIREGDKDDNPQTEPEPFWLPLIPTPAFPEHVSGHSSFSSAAATVLAYFNGGDKFAFITSSDGLRGVVRRFRTFSEAANEAGMSRIYGGIHFMSGNTQGLSVGKRVADYVILHFFVRKTDGSAVTRR